MLADRLFVMLSKLIYILKIQIILVLLIGYEKIEGRLYIVNILRAKMRQSNSDEDQCVFKKYYYLGVQQVLLI